MSTVHPEGATVPRGVLLATGALLACTMLLAGAARWSGIGTTANPESVPVDARRLHFEDRSDGAVRVVDADRLELVEVLQPGEDGFARSVLRGLVRERRLRGIGSGPPFQLTRWADGRLSLDDPATGRRVELAAFGPTNAGAFVRLLDAGRDRG